MLASSATPPFTPLGRFRGRTLLDGGMVDNAPASIAEAVDGVRRNLVLLTRYPAPECPCDGRRLYVAPSSKPPLERWDYTQPHLMADNVALGALDAERYWPRIEEFLEGSEV